MGFCAVRRGSCRRSASSLNWADAREARVNCNIMGVVGYCAFARSVWDDALGFAYEGAIVSALADVPTSTD